MVARTAFALVLVASTGFAQIPDRPEKLAFQPITFQAPRVKDYQAKLSNGIPVFVASTGKDGTPLVRVSASWRGGSYLDPRGKEGLAALLGSQLTQGGTAKLDPAALDDRLEALAASLTSACAETSCTLSLQVLEKDLDEGLDLFMQALTEPAFAQDRLDLAKRLANQRLSRRNDDVTSIAGYQMPYLLYGDGFFASAGDTKSSLEAITRDDLKATHGRLLDPANLVVAAAGRIDRKALLDKLDQRLGTLAPASGAQISPKVPAPDFPRKPGIYVSDKDAPQAMVRWAMPGMRRTDPDWHAAFVMNQVLGGPGFTSRLMKKIRSDEGLTYGIYSTLEPGTYWRGDIAGRVQTKNRSVAYVLKLTLEEMRKLRDEPVAAEELRVIKDGIIESFPGQWSSKQAIVTRFADEAREGWPPDWWADYREKIQAVTPADVQRMARKLLDPQQLVIVAVGKASDMEVGDTDHPGALKDAVAPLPVVRLPLRDPLTLAPVTQAR
jgi:zinc protease